MTNHCVFCLKINSKISTVNFWPVWQKFVSGEKIFHFRENGKNINTDCCADCSLILSKFCDTFREWEVLQLKLSWQLETLLKIMASTSSLAIKTIDVHNTEYESNQVTKLRGDFTNRCTEKLLQIQSRVLLGRTSVEHASVETIAGETFNHFSDELDTTSECNNRQIFEDLSSRLEDNVQIKSEPESPPKPLPPRTIPKPKSKRGSKRVNPVLYGDQKKRHPCTISACSEKFYTKELRDIHTTYYGTFACQFCPVVRSYAPDLSLHEQEEHGPEGPITPNWGKVHTYRCPSCPYSAMRSRDYIRHHAMEHLGLKDICVTCSICQDGFTQPRRLRDHMKKLHKTEGENTSQIFRCDQCPAFYNQNFNLILPKNRVHLKDGKCPLCQKKFERLQQLRSHMDYYHGSENPDKVFVCGVPNCEKRLATPKLLKKHEVKFKLKQNQIKTGERLLCPDCGKSFKAKHLLGIHRRGVHGAANEVCPECGKAFRTLAGLKEHREYHKPKSEWKFTCATCGKKFVKSHKLTEHQLVHTGEKRFICQLCGVKFGYATTLRNHMRKVHGHKVEHVKTDTI